MSEIRPSAPELFGKKALTREPKVEGLGIREDLPITNDFERSVPEHRQVLLKKDSSTSIRKTSEAPTLGNPEADGYMTKAAMSWCWTMMGALGAILAGVVMTFAFHALLHLFAPLAFVMPVVGVVLALIGLVNLAKTIWYLHKARKAS